MPPAHHARAMYARLPNCPHACKCLHEAFELFARQAISNDCPLLRFLFPYFSMQKRQLNERVQPAFTRNNYIIQNKTTPTGRGYLTYSSDEKAAAEAQTRLKMLSNTNTSASTRVDEGAALMESDRKASNKKSSAAENLEPLETTPRN